jgi:hypothetical protein
MLWQRVRGAVGGTGVFNGFDSTTRVAQGSIAQQGRRLVDPRERYAVLRAYYYGNSLYDQLSRALYDSGLWTPAVKAIRNPAYRIVEAHVGHVWPGDLPAALPIQTENDQIIDPIHQFWAWSNWAAKKQLYIRTLATCGDAFAKVCTRDRADGTPARVYLELIDPAHVCDFDLDERGYVVWIRIDVPQTRRVAGKLERYTHVEVWDKAAGTYQRWEVDETQRTLLGEAIPSLTPTEERTLASMGISFVPIVHSKFIDVGEARGVGAYLLQLDKIDAINQDATRLAQMLFRHGKPTLVVHGAGKDATGRPLPAPQLQGHQNGTAHGTTPAEDAEIWAIPGDAAVDSLVPALPYDAHRNQILDGILDLERDRPELAVARVQELGAHDLSGRALRFLLGPFVKLETEVRGNAEDALARLDMMALTIGQAAGLFGDLGGRFEDGAFEHQFKERPIIESSELEDAQTAQLLGDASVKKLAAGWSQAAVFRDAGMSEAEIEQVQQEKAEQDVIVQGVGQ